MAHIKAPVPITGNHVTLNFVHGEADTENAWLIQWFKEHGYSVTEDTAEPEGDKDPETPPTPPVDPSVDGSEGNDPAEPEKPVEGQQEGEKAKPTRRKRSE